MKNVKINQELRNRIISGGLSVVLVMSGFAMGKVDSKRNISSDETEFATEIATETNDNTDEVVDRYLSNYISERNSLEEEIKNLKEKKEKLQNVEEFDIDDLIVMENVNDKGESNLYILHNYSNSPDTYFEYHHLFKAWYRMHPYHQEHILDFCPTYVHFDEGEPLFNYLNDEEINKLTENDGVFTTIELDEILNRLRNEYKQNQEKEHSKKQLQKK